jgi:hypothetical protein
MVVSDRSGLKQFKWVIWEVSENQLGLQVLEMLYPKRGNSDWFDDDAHPLQTIL